MIGVERREYYLGEHKIGVNILWSYEDEQQFTSDGDVGNDKFAEWTADIMWRDLPPQLIDEDAVINMVKDDIVSISSQGIKFKNK